MKVAIRATTDTREPPRLRSARYQTFLQVLVCVPFIEQIMAVYGLRPDRIMYDCPQFSSSLVHMRVLPGTNTSGKKIRYDMNFRVSNLAELL